MITSIRNAALLIGGACLSVSVLGCTSMDAADQPKSQSSESSTISALPDPTPFTVEEYEPVAELKQAAVDFLESALTVDANDAAIPSRERVPPELASDTAFDDLAPLLGDNAISTEVVYPQLGGLTRTKASIIALVDTQRFENQQIVRTTRVLDLRLTRSDGKWTVTAVKSTGGNLKGSGPTQPTDSSEPSSELVAQVLEDDNIALTDTSIQDLLEGDIDARVLEVVRGFARDHQLSVAVLRTGHPRDVFGTDRQSNHTRGKAVDIWEIDGKPVSYYAQQSADDNPARALMEAALADGSDEVGGPWAFATRDGATFSNIVHQDHIHIGYEN